MQATPPARPTVSWVFDAAVIAAGITLAVGTAVGFVTSGQLDARWVVTCALCIPLMALISRFPLELSRRGIGIEVGFESAVLVALVVLGDDLGALTIWALGQALAQATSGKRMEVRWFNASITVISGTSAVAVMHLGGGLGTTSLRELAAVGAGCAVYFVVDYVVSAVSVALEERSSLASQLRHNNGLLAGLAFVGIDSLGYLAALVGRALPAWASLLLGVPLATILVASRALSRSDEHQRRLTSLFEASGVIFGAGSADEVLDLVSARAMSVLERKDAAAELRGEPPGEKEVGALLGGSVASTVQPGEQHGEQHGEQQPLWLVAPRNSTKGSSGALDRQALEALAGVGDQTLARLALVEQLGRQARTDGLTGLPNRPQFNERLVHALADATSRSQVAVLYLDLDGFKSVNDRFGHAAGDELLCIVADRLGPVVRAQDCVARLGGDEFAILLTDVADVSEVERVCHRVLTAVRREAVVAGHGVAVSTSVGVVLSEGGDDAAEVMRNADMAMYVAKGLGKSQFQIYEKSLGADRILRLELVEALRKGIEHDLVVHYQPVVSLGSGRVCGVEALVRWRRDGALVPPDLFIPAAEDSGLIVPLGRRVLAQVVADSTALVQAAGAPIDLAVNMSAHQLYDPEFLPQVSAAVSVIGESRLVLEMTETVLVQDDPQTAATLNRLTAAGARLSIDDFGVGFSSIGYLQHLPVGVVKIDRSFVRDIDHLPRSRALVDAILVMASALELDVVAEGIERESQADVLRLAGCADGQGYLYAKPQPLEQVLDTLRTQSAKSISAAS